MEEIIKHQPVINIGIIGHVANGKSSMVNSLTQKKTQQHSKELERNITIRIGYANCKIWKCDTCKPPRSYSSSNSMTMSKTCIYCNSVVRLINHISFVDCPGHNDLTSIMLNGSSVMDYTILVESFTNDTIPAPQTKEHYAATRAAGIPTSMIVMNKLDLVSRSVAESKIDIMNEYNIPIVPISATFNLNIDVICEYIGRLEVKRDYKKNFKMIVIRSFDINKPGVDVRTLKGGVIGGTIMRGTLEVDDEISIYPGVYKKEDDKFKYKPLKGRVLSIKSDENELTSAVSGGLLGIQLTIDPALTRNDLLVGSLVLKSKDIDKTIFKVCDTIVVEISEYICDKRLLKDTLMINVNSCNLECQVSKFRENKNKLELILTRPIAIDDIDNMVTIQDKINGRILARGNIINGRECDK